jgi:hypothetical protein
MKKIILFFFSCIIYLASFSQSSKPTKMVLNKTQAVSIVETACGTCMFKMEGKTCALAIKLNGKPYFVDGTGIDDHGDAHDKDGFCNATRKAKVQGKIVGDRYLVTYFELVKETNIK